MLVVAQIGLSVALLAAAGWLTKSYFVLQQEGAGFHAAGVWTAQINLPRRRYTRPESWPVFERQALEKLAALPGVSAAGFTSSLPFAGDNNQGSIVIADAAADGAPPPHAQSWVISDGFLTSLGIQVIAGRNFHATESERVAIVDENLAAKYWPGGGALGQRLRAATDGADEWYTVVGVVPAVKQASLAEVPLKDTVYWHYSQRPMNGGAFAVRTTLPPEQLTRAATAAIRSLDADIAVFDVQPMDARIARSLGPQRTPMVLTTVFAAVAFALAVIGVFAVLSWTVAQRAGEIGVRVALGARADDIVGMVVREGGRLIAIGIGVGAACALPLGVTLASQLRGVGAFDPFVLGGSALGLGAAALLASWLPARRAALIDPLQALRAD
jgi:predicted permease